MTPDELRSLAVRYTVAWCGGDPTAVAAHYAEDGRLQVNDGPVASGRAAIAAVARSFMTAFPDMEVILDDVVSEGSRHAAYHWTLTGANTGPGGTGNRIRISGCEHWTLGADGLIAASEGRFDETEYRRQLEQGV